MPDIECISEDSPLLVVQEDRSDDLTKDPQQTETENPVSLLSRALALLLMSAVGFGAFFCFDNPGALQSEVTRKETFNILKQLNQTHMSKFICKLLNLYLTFHILLF